AQRYRVDLATDAGFTSPLLTDYENRGTTLSLSTRVLAQELLQGTYFWRVQTQDNQDQWGAESSVFQFTVGLPRKPKDGTFTTNARITLQWTRAKDASRYRLLVDDHSDFSSPVVEYITTSNRNTRYKPSRNNPLPVGNLYWRVDVEINNLWVVAPVVFDLTITPKPLSAPKQFTPANRLETNDTTPTFTWEAVVDPLSQPVTYQLQIATNGSFRDIVIDTTTAATSFTPGAAMAEGRYFWRVRTLNYLGAPGRWSRSSIFTVDTTPPQPPALVAPRDGSTVDRSNVTFKWRSSRTAVQYYLRWGTTNPPVGSGVDNGRRTSYKLTDPLLADIYYWQVQAVDRAGNLSAWSTPFSFTAESPADAVPVLNRFTTDTPELTWTPISWAQGYELQIALDTDFNGPVYLINTLAANELAHVVQQSLPDGIYYWRIRAKVDVTTWGNWSTTGTFLIQQ
ncbi:MAG: DUF4962 domain-containing protein, partial [Anaerolineae bacterium]|nr:DUF4962 domain-containing protein [Anaerolineae bacterium]